MFHLNKLYNSIALLEEELGMILDHFSLPLPCPAVHVLPVSPPDLFRPGTGDRRASLHCSGLVNVSDHANILIK